MSTRCHGCYVAALFRKPPKHEAGKCPTVICVTCGKARPEYTPNFPGQCKGCYVRTWGSTR